MVALVLLPERLRGLDWSDLERFLDLPVGSRGDLERPLLGSVATEPSAASAFNFAFPSTETVSLGYQTVSLFNFLIRTF